MNEAEQLLAERFESWCFNTPQGPKPISAKELTALFKTQNSSKTLAKEIGYLCQKKMALELKNNSSSHIPTTDYKDAEELDKFLLANSK